MERSATELMAGPLRPRTQAFGMSAAANESQHSVSAWSATRARRKGLAIRSSCKERAREHEKRLLKEGKEAIAREIAARNRRAGCRADLGNARATLCALMSAIEKIRHSSIWADGGV